MLVGLSVSRESTPYPQIAGSKTPLKSPAVYYPKPINLAALLKDGQRISIPTLGPTRGPDETSAATLSHLININTATLAELDNLPNIGPVLAQAIITFRDENGPFETIEEIQKVPGIGSAIFENIKDLITVD
jgi:competence protein ComEA